MQISPKAYTAIKDLSNQLAVEQGFIPVDFRKPSREPVRQSQAERQIILRGATSWKQELCEVIDMAVATAKDMTEFEDILNQYGIKVGLLFPITGKMPIMVRDNSLKPVSIKRRRIYACEKGYKEKTDIF